MKLRLTAEKGHYLARFARLLLAVAALRDHDRATAKTILASLSLEFPANRLYRQELSRLQVVSLLRSSAAKSPFRNDFD
jgi:hypothetical protein